MPSLQNHIEKISFPAIVNKIKQIDEDGIRTHAGKPQWISSPSP